MTNRSHVGIPVAFVRAACSAVIAAAAEIAAASKRTRRHITHAAPDVTNIRELTDSAAFASLSRHLLETYPTTAVTVTIQSSCVSEFMDYFCMQASVEIVERDKPRTLDGGIAFSEFRCCFGGSRARAPDGLRSPLHIPVAIPTSLFPELAARYPTHWLHPSPGAGGAAAVGGAGALPDVEITDEADDGVPHVTVVPPSKFRCQAKDVGCPFSVQINRFDSGLATVTFPLGTHSRALRWAPACTTLRAHHEWCGA